MIWLRARSKLLLLIAVSISFYALYKRITWQHKNQPKVQEIKKFVKAILPEPTVHRNSEKLNAISLPNVKDIKNNVLYHKALDINFAQKVHNVDLFGFHEEDAAIIAVQVHSRAEYLQELLNSLKNVRNIDKATLIISMDKFSSEMDRLISTINFCRYMVIFFPYSMQLFPNSFPGEDPNDCSRDITKSQAIAKKCNNADFPDSYGHYREVKYVQTKHHWMWKLHMIFSGIKMFTNSVGPVILLEEDYFVLPDLIYCANKAIQLKTLKCRKCTLISLGNYKSEQDYSLSHHVEIHSWVSSTSNMGIVLTREAYDVLTECSDTICEYDDYNWDWSLQAALTVKFPHKVYTMQFTATRVYHLGDCGGMHVNKHCELKTYLQRIKAKTSDVPLFPSNLHVARDNPAVSNMPKKNGGWGDLRDHTLCKSFKFLYRSNSGN